MPTPIVNYTNLTNLTSLTKSVSTSELQKKDHILTNLKDSFLDSYIKIQKLAKILAKDAGYSFTLEQLTHYSTNQQAVKFFKISHISYCHLTGENVPLTKALIPKDADRLIKSTSKNAPSYQLLKIKGFEIIEDKNDKKIIITNDTEYRLENNS